MKKFENVTIANNKIYNNKRFQTCFLTVESL